MLRWSAAKPAQDDVLSQTADFRLGRAIHVDEPEDWWSVLLEIEGSIDDFAERAAPLAEDIIIPVAYDAEDRTVPASRQPLVVFARQTAIAAFNMEPEAYGILSLLLGAETPRRFLDRHATPPPMTEIPVSEDTVVMAVIDDGIGIAHNLFRTGPTASRVQFAAILEAEPLVRGSRASVGRALMQDDIEDLLSQCTRGAFLDEDLFYTATGQVNFRTQVFSTVALRRSHGTHVTALAAGYAMEDQVENRPIICAALPARVVEDTTGVSFLPSLYLAFHMLVKQARRFRTQAGHAPVQFNFSYGNSGGPHDGTGLFAMLFEYYFGAHAQCPQRAWLTLPAGNSNLRRLHAQAAGAKTKLDLDVLPDDRTTSEVQIWTPFNGSVEPAPVQVSVETPHGALSLIGTTDTMSQRLIDDNGREAARLSYEFVGAPVMRGLFLLNINATASHLDEVLAPSGTWRLEIIRDLGAEPTEVPPVEVWIRRDETLPGFRPGGRQAFFSNDDYRRFGKFGLPLAVDPKDTPSPIRRAMTISGFACGQSPITVASYTEREEVVSLYSGAGPLNRPSSPQGSDRDGPDLAAKGDDSFVLPGVLSAGSRSGTFVRQGGTSAATPRVARAASSAIGAASGTARDWARDPLRDHADGIARFALKDGTPQRSGSGGYAIEVQDHLPRPDAEC
ncbi:S8 family serine peptidase [Tateyamaria omphalii]|uniref:Peptidase S8/S53 domain-containing protein n=1 Tax=Tateyamaria omphalii TaxID=299262 RepID=A0A1P8MSF3_9RHOB|nr:S8 family serine peptidase [Tateyamaria omphalii]APX10968.1 hypothetical protein BWR18_04125 [Tateyamaria omphalii]